MKVMQLLVIFAIWSFLATLVTVWWVQVGML